MLPRHCGTTSTCATASFEGCGLVRSGPRKTAEVSRPDLHLEGGSSGECRGPLARAHLRQVPLLHRGEPDRHLLADAQAIADVADYITRLAIQVPPGVDDGELVDHGLRYMPDAVSPATDVPRTAMRSR
jgi:hypothetical protein